MRGVLLEENLKVFAWTALMTADMAVVEDDGHLFPLAQTFFWPDESPGLVLRLEEDESQFPTLVEMTHVASGRKVEVPLDTKMMTVLRLGSGGGGGSGVRLSSVLMLAAGFTPTGTGADVVEVPAPFDPSDGTSSVVWVVRRVDFRVMSPGGSPSFDIEKSTASGVFTPSTITSVTMPVDAYETNVLPVGMTIASGNKVRMNVIGLGTATAWTITLLLEEQ